MTSKSLLTCIYTTRRVQASRQKLVNFDVIVVVMMTSTSLLTCTFPGQRVQASRRELVNFDRSQKEGGKKVVVSPLSRAGIVHNTLEEGAVAGGRCYGCAAAATEHCITLLRALATNPALRAALCQHGLINNLMEYNLRRGTVQVLSTLHCNYYITYYLSITI